MLCCSGFSPDPSGITYNKILASKRLLQNARNLLPTTSLLNVYYSHVYSHYMYGLSVSDTMIPKNQLKRLFLLQSNCIRIISKKPKNHESDILYKQLRIIRLPDLINQEQYKLGYKVSHKLLPEPLIELFDKKGGKKCHRYPTRNKQVPNIQTHSSTQMNTSFLCHSLHLYMQLPGITKGSGSLSLFCKNIKEKLIY